MIRLILVAVFLITFLIVSIPILFLEWIYRKFNPYAADLSSLRIVQWAFKVVLFLAGTKVTIIGEDMCQKTRRYSIFPTT